jgi:hypothetical protein
MHVAVQFFVAASRPERLKPHEWRLRLRMNGAVPLLSEYALLTWAFFYTLCVCVVCDWWMIHMKGFGRCRSWTGDVPSEITVHTGRLMVLGFVCQGRDVREVSSRSFVWGKLVRGRLYIYICMYRCWRNDVWEVAVFMAAVVASPTPSFVKMESISGVREDGGLSINRDRRWKPPILT